MLHNYIDGKPFTTICLGRDIFNNGEGGSLLVKLTEDIRGTGEKTSVKVMDVTKYKG